MLHCISLPEGKFGTNYPGALFTNQLDVNAHPSFADLAGVEVAPHLLIDRDGDIEQFVGFDDAAWHAGVSQWKHVSGCNNQSIGIELEGDVSSAFTKDQYTALVQVLLALIKRYPQLGVDTIVGHNDVACGRKQDPGPFFDWQGLLMELATSA